MNKKRYYSIGVILSIIVFFVCMFLPKSLGDAPSIIGGISLVMFPVFLIALIVSRIKSKRVTRSSEATPPPPATSTTAPVNSEDNKAPSIERVHVRGVNYYIDNIIAVSSPNDAYELSKRELQEEFPGERVYQYQFFVNGSLVPEPDNEYDPNAIMVQADGLCIGHVPKGSTAHIRKLMESGRIKSMDLTIGGGKYKEVLENDDGTFELDGGEHNYTAVLELHLIDEH